MLIAGLNTDAYICVCCCALQVLVQIVDNHVHRVYICKENDKGQEVVGVVTPTDILSLIAGTHASMLAVTARSGFMMSTGQVPVWGPYWFLCL